MAAAGRHGDFAGRIASSRPPIELAPHSPSIAQQQKGQTVITPEHRESTQSAVAGLLAVLRAALHARGNGAPRVWLLPVLVLGLLACTAAPALALEGYEPGTPASFGEPGSGPGQLEAPEGVAVNDKTGNVYIADTGNSRVDEFKADGTFIRAWGWGVADGKGELEVCTTKCQKGLSGSAPGEFVSPAFVAVDNSSGSTGAVYVSDRGGDNTVTKFTEAGALVKTWGTEGQLKETAAGKPFTETRGVAVDQAGNLWVYDGSNVDVFTEAGSFVPAMSFNAERRADYFGLSPSTPTAKYILLKV